MSNTKAVVILVLIILGVVGFLWGLSMHIALEPTDEAYAQQKVGDVICLVSLLMFVFGWSLKDGK